MDEELAVTLCQRLPFLDVPDPYQGRKVAEAMIGFCSGTPFCLT